MPHFSIAELKAHSAPIAIAVLCSAIAILSPSFAYDLPNDGMPTEIWLGLQIAMGAAMLWSWKKGTFTGKAIIGWAILFRLILLPSTPIHENDFYRYLWDGKSLAAGINPYEFEPGALWIRDGNITNERPDDLVPEVIWKGRYFTTVEHDRLDILESLRAENPIAHDRIGHPAVPTIYPPVAQAVFWFVAVVFGGTLTGLKIVLLLFEFGLLALLCSLLRKFALPIGGLILYAWNPLVLKEFVNSAHYDIVAIFLIVLAVWLFAFRKHAVWIALALAAATLAKLFAILLVPLLLPPSKWRSWAAYLVFVGACIAAWLPFALWDDIGFARVFEGLGIYNAVWQANGFIFPVLSEWIGFRPAKLTLAATLILVIAYLTFIRPAKGVLATLTNCLVVFGTLFVLSPTAFPWYFCWVLPFVCLFPRWPWLILALLLPISYYIDHFQTAHFFGPNTILTWLVWGTFLALLIKGKSPARK